MSKEVIAIAISLLACLPAANAAPGDDAMIAQLKQIATTGQDASTAAQVDSYIDQNKDAISAILDSCTAYLKQTAGATDDSAAPATPAPSAAQNQATQNQGTQTQGQDQPQTGALQGSEVQASTGAQASSGLQPSGGLTTSSVQPSSGLQASTGLQTGHLAGYPSLPAGDPITSVTVLTAEQTAYVAKIRAENIARKESLMTSASGGQ